jgi:Holliday junction resolvasome RuvABC endonuclease subunit
MTITTPTHQPERTIMYPSSIVGIDPGVSTGLAVAVMGQHGRYQIATATCIARDKDDDMTTSTQIWRFIRPPVQVVVMEQFAARTISKYGLHTVETVGGVMALCDAYNIQVIRHTPQQRRPYLKLARSIVAKRENHTKHEIDALAQMLCYMWHVGYLQSLDALP